MTIIVCVWFYVSKEQFGKWLGGGGGVESSPKKTGIFP